MESPESSDNRETMVSVRAAINMYGTKIMGSSAGSVKKPTSRMRDLHVAQRDVGQFKGNIRTADSAKAKAESELSSAKRTVKELRLKIEESNLRVKSQKKVVKVSSDAFGYEGVLREMELVKKELTKVKLDIASQMGEKTRAEETIAESTSKMLVLASSVDSLKEKIEEVNEEQVLVELATIEALREFADVDARRRSETEEISLRLEKTRRDVRELIEQVEKSREYELELNATLSDVAMLQNELKMIRELESKRFHRKESDNRLSPISVGESKDQAETSASVLLEIHREIESAKTELDVTKEESFRHMRSMDAVRNELTSVTSEVSRLEKLAKKTDSTINNLNSKLLRAKSKLESASANEEKARSLLDNLTLTLEKLNAQRDAAIKEKEVVIREKVEAMEVEIRKSESEIDATVEKLKVALEELEAVKTTESRALEKLETLVKDTMRARESAVNGNRFITISKFEYEYLRNHASAAEEIADKKVAAAEAWIEALKASEKEIQISTDIARKRIEEANVDIPASQSQKNASEGELVIWNQNCEQEAKVYNRRRTSTSARRISIGKGNTTPVRPRYRKSVSPAGQNSCSFQIKRKRVMPNLSKFFVGRRIITDT